MPLAVTAGIELCYEEIGDPDAPVLLLVMGLGGQLTGWDEGLCRRLASRGFRVVRYDNRDVGLSTHLDEPVPDLAAVVGGDRSQLRYGLEDMADDAAALLDHLGAQRAHVVGMSMGGMIAQLVALRHAGRVASLCSIMSTTGDPSVGQPSAEAVGVLLRPAAPDRDAAMEAAVAGRRVTGSPGFELDEARVRARAAVAYDRSSDPGGSTRHLAAILCAADRTEALRRLGVPTLVVHGDSDPLIHCSGGVATAEAVPGARLVLVPGMGHDLPEPIWPMLVDAIAANADRGRSGELGEPGEAGCP
ncbi:MAG: alpha/beta fold hydrolase [Acidimicrobiales bacterium]